MTAVALNPTVKWFAEIGLADLDQVGGKNASLGEMVGNLAAPGSRSRTGSRPLRTRTGGSWTRRVSRR